MISERMGLWLEKMAEEAAERRETAITNAYEEHRAVCPHFLTDPDPIFHASPRIRVIFWCDHCGEVDYSEADDESY